jgi:hypothetical protein
MLLKGVVLADSRVSVLWRVAELYTELVDPLNGPSGVRGDGEAIGFAGHDKGCRIGSSLRCSCSKRTLDEYERLVRLMRDDRHEPLLELNGQKVSVRSLWWHLEHWHHRATRVIRHVPVQANGKKGRKLRVLNHDGTPATRPTIHYLRDPKADRVRAERAIEFIASRWDHRRIGEPMLPSQVLEGFQVAA